MATITVINSTDTLADSRAVINTNFSNLNTDKVEADSTDTLTNKTIDADNNTLSNIEYDAIKSSSRTGSDTKLVTGTAGTSGNLASWDANGDIVDSTYSVLDEDTMTSNSDTAVPTQQSVKQYVDANSSYKEMFLPILRQNSSGYGYDSNIGAFPLSTVTSSQQVYFAGRAPASFTTLSEAKIVMIPDATETITWDLDTNIAAAGEDYNNHQESSTNDTTSVTTQQITEIDISGELTTLAANDYFAVNFQSDTDNLRVVGLFISWT